MLSNIPVIGLLVIFAVIFVGGISFITRMRRSGKEQYGLSFFKSWQFLMLSFSSFCFYVSYSFFSLVLWPNDESAAEILEVESIRDNLYWGAGSIIAAFGIALLMNIKKSTVLFGLTYTIAQSIAALFSILILCLAFLGLFEIKNRSA